MKNVGIISLPQRRVLRLLAPRGDCSRCPSWRCIPRKTHYSVRDIHQALIICTSHIEARLGLASLKAPDAKPPLFIRCFARIAILALVLLCVRDNVRNRWKILRVDWYSDEWFEYWVIVTMFKLRIGAWHGWYKTFETFSSPGKRNFLYLVVLSTSYIQFVPRLPQTNSPKHGNNSIYANLPYRF